MNVEVVEAVRPVEFASAPAPCPCCGHYNPTADPKIIYFDHPKGLLFRGQTKIHLQPMEADLLLSLMEAWPSVASRETVINNLYGDKYPDGDERRNSRLWVYISNVRRCIGVFDLVIDNVPKRGWLLSKRSTVN